MKLRIRLGWVSNVEDSTGLRVKYQGQVHQLDLDTLLVSLLNLAEITRIIAEQTAPEVGVQIKISAPEKGSFKIDLEFGQKVEGLFKAVGPVIPQILNSVLSFFQIRRLLKGEKPDKTETNGKETVIIKGNNNVVVSNSVFRVYERNAPVHAATSRLFEGMLDNPEIEGFELEAVNGGTFEVPSDEFVNMAKSGLLVRTEEEVEIRERAELTILKLVFQRNRKWEFVYQGNKIAALVEDDAFWVRVEQRQTTFAKGDRLIAVLEIHKTFDEGANCFLNQSYRVTKVVDYDLALRPFQPGFLKAPNDEPER